MGRGAWAAGRSRAWRAAPVLLALVLLTGCLAEEGSKDEQGGDGGGSVTFSEVQAAFTTATCYDCHNPGAPATTCESAGCHPGSGRTPSLVSPLTHADLVDQTTMALPTTDIIVDPGSSATSVLWWVISQDSQYTSKGGAMLTSMPVSSLSQTDKDNIQSWIDDGAPE